MAADEPRDPSQCALHHVLATHIREIRDTLKQIADRLGSGDVTLATLKERVHRLEVVVYGGCGFVLLAVLGALVYLVVRGH